MRTRLLHATAVLALLATASTMAQSVAPPEPVKTVEFEAKSVGRTMKYNVVLPPNYAAEEPTATRSSTCSTATRATTPTGPATTRRSTPRRTT